MTRLLDLFSRFFSASSAKSEEIILPEDIEQLLVEKKVHLIQGYIQGVLRASRLAPEFDLILAKARSLNWPPMEMTKLEVFGHYYRGDTALAFNQARLYAVDGPEFDPDLFVIAACSLYDVGEFERAYRLIAAARERETVFARRADFHIVKALICWATNHLGEIKPAIDAARDIEPDNSVAAFNAYAMFFELGEIEAFEAVRREIMAGKYQRDDVGFALAMIELAQDHYKEGFDLLELRYKHVEANRYLNSALIDKPRWQGEDALGKSVLVSAEQGIGDTIMMVRYLQQLRPLAGLITIETQPETISLLNYNFPEIRILPRDYAKLPPVDFDLWIGSMSLPFVLGSTADNIPGKAGYLKVPPESQDYWMRRVDEMTRPGRRIRIGLAWSGNPTHRADRRRSIPFARIAEAIRGVDADFFTLQTKVPEIRPANLLDVSDEIVTLADTAALIACMDLVITVDTSSVHLAGALGKEAWLLLPYRYEWRWGLEGEKNNWYASVSVIRQPKGGDWATVLDQAFGSRLLERIDSFNRG